MRFIEHHEHGRFYTPSKLVNFYTVLTLYAKQRFVHSTNLTYLKSFCYFQLESTKL